MRRRRLRRAHGSRSGSRGPRARCRARRGICARWTSKLPRKSRTCEFSLRARGLPAVRPDAVARLSAAMARAAEGDGYAVGREGGPKANRVDARPFGGLWLRGWRRGKAEHRRHAETRRDLLGPPIAARRVGAGSMPASREAPLEWPPTLREGEGEERDPDDGEKDEGHDHVTSIPRAPVVLVGHRVPLRLGTGTMLRAVDRG